MSFLGFGHHGCNCYDCRQKRKLENQIDKRASRMPGADPYAQRQALEARCPYDHQRSSCTYCGWQRPRDTD